MYIRAAVGRAGIKGRDTIENARRVGMGMGAAGEHERQLTVQR